MTEPEPPRLLHNRFAQDARGVSRMRADETCFRRRGEPSFFHGERQDTSLPGWRRMLALIDEAAADGREVFRPLVELTPEERQDLVTLPPEIARLTRVTHLSLYGSPLVRIPPEIGAMVSLETFEPYTSRSLHWFPYELTRCPRLRRSTVSTRGLYGNYKFRPHFPQLPPEGTLPTATGLDPRVWGVEQISACSVCAGPIDPARFRQVWISLGIATDVLPLLVNACSAACVEALPTPHQGYVERPHRGGKSIVQPGPR
ncbi:hypothetical protein [Catenuloplanes japonicus]|uniref:hypothetical protein n=1 Tax=Catenuloplanes japonicus TaxID=33876 RepID=UPI0005256682|nr:hypothetical protein [Catenuloplanes japonicus]